MSFRRFRIGCKLMSCVRKHDADALSNRASDQVRYLEKDYSKIRARHGSLPWHVFFHIPLPVFQDLNSQDPFPCPGSLHEEPKLGVQDGEEGLWTALLKMTDVRSIHVGHDHGSTWCCPMAGKALCFARHSGYGGYGDWERGARQIELFTNKSWKTWVRLEGGSVTDESGVYDT